MPPKRDNDPDYEPSSEEVEEEEEEEVVVDEETGTESKKKSPKKSTKSKKSKKKKDDDEYKPSDPEDIESEENISDTAEQSSSQKVKDKTKKVAQKLKDKKDEILDQGKLSPDVIKSPSKKSGKISDTEGDVTESPEYDELLAKVSLSRRPVFNKNVSLIGALNIQAFGTKKSSNRHIMRIIADILRHYGIILCQEIRANEDIIQTLTDEVSTPATPYAYVASHPIGRTTYQERYVFLYRSNEWKVLEDYVIDDDQKLGDKFIREPYVARFQHLERKNVRITLVGCHTQPDNAFEEIKTLINTVYMDVRKKLQRDNVQEKRQLDRGIEAKEPNKFLSCLRRIFCCGFCCDCCGGCGGCGGCCGCCENYSSVSTRDFSEDKVPSGADSNEPIIMMGDFNAASPYVNKSQRAELDTLLKKNNLIWGIQDNMDTTVADGPDTAYDRFIFESANERRWIGNTRVWKFDDGWLNGKADEVEVKKAAKRVTDHYPIEFELKL